MMKDVIYMAETTQDVLKIIKDRLETSGKKAPKTIIIFPDFLKALATAVDEGRWNQNKLDQVFNDKVVDVFTQHIADISKGKEGELEKAIEDFRKNTLSDFVKECAKRIQKLGIKNLAACGTDDKKKIAKVLGDVYDSYAGFSGSLWQKIIPYWRNFDKAFTKDKDKTTGDLIKAAK